VLSTGDIDGVVAAYPPSGGNCLFAMNLDGVSGDELLVRYPGGAFEVSTVKAGKWLRPPTFQPWRIRNRFSDAEGWSYGNRFFPMDINGDGRDDMVIRFPDGGMEVRLSNGRSFDYSYST
jgi:hypothetical protein